MLFLGYIHPLVQQAREAVFLRRNVGKMSKTRRKVRNMKALRVVKAGRSVSFPIVVRWSDLRNSIY